ncbi:MAG: Phage protein Gp19/Gp15/Gp42 [Rhodoglobus sp.]|nr:Phage protein Gp19/Gp15/Gp42 [Rhodoglobus sp.]
MLARVFRNPGGILSETEGLYTYRLDKAVASGRLAPSDAELDALGRRARLRAALGELDGYTRQRSPEHGVHPFLTGG